MSTCWVIVNLFTHRSTCKPYDVTFFTVAVVCSEPILSVVFRFFKRGYLWNQIRYQETVNGVRSCFSRTFIQENKNFHFTSSLTVMLLLYPLQILVARAWLFFHSMFQNFAAWGLGIWPFGKIFKCGVNLDKYSFFDVILGCHIVKGPVVNCMNINLQIICEAFRLACDQTFSKIRLGLLNWNWCFGYFINILSTWFLYTGWK